MYREESKPPTCPMCAGVQLTPETMLDTKEGYVSVFFDKTDVEPSFFGEQKRFATNITRCRVCLECGYVMPFLSAARLATLRAELHRSEPIAPTDPPP